MGRQLQGSSGKDEQVTVLSTGQIPEINLSPPGNRLNGNEGQPVDRSSVNPMQVAPIKADARDAPLALPVGYGMKPVMQGTPDEDVPKMRMFRVEKTMQVLDPTSQSRTTLREGKEISSAHYNIRALQRQGVKLRDITDLDPNAPIA